MSRADHIAVITSPLPGHLNPVQALAVELVKTGARVTIVHVEGARRFVRNDAASFVGLPPHASAPDALSDYLAVLAQPTGLGGLTRVIRATAGMTDALLQGAPEILERIGANVVLGDAVEPAGQLIARRTGLPFVSVVTGLPLLRDDGVPPPFLGWGYRSDAWGRFRNRAGYAVANVLMRPITQGLDTWRRAWGLSADEGHPLLQVAQCPRSLDFARSDLPANFRYGAPWRCGADKQVEIEADGRPLVFCSLGTLQGSRRDLFATMSAACAAIGARAIIGHAGGLTAAQEASLPGDPLVRAFWPQETVLPQCAAAILHGGFNSVLDALAVGVPILALPIAFEQPATAARIAHIGAGRVLRARSATVERLAAALHDLLDQPSYRRAAERVATEIHMAGGAAAAAAAINAALARHRGHGEASTTERRDADGARGDRRRSESTSPGRA